MIMSDLFCLICDASLEISSSVNIAYTFLSHNGELLANFISRVLCVAVSDLKSSYACSQCYNLFQMLAQAQKTVLNIRCEIFNIYHGSDRRKSVRQIPNNDIDINLNVSFEDTELHTNILDKKLKENFVLKCTQSRIIEKNLSNSDLTKSSEEAKKSFQRKLNNKEELNQAELLNYKVTDANLKNNETVKDDISNNPTAVTNDNNVYSTITLQESEAYCPQNCKFCGKLFKSINEYKAHLIEHTSKQYYQCQKCKEKFADISLANVHALKVHIEEENCITFVPDSNKSISKNSIKTDTTFSYNNAQTQNVPQLMNESWKEIENRVTGETSNKDVQVGPEKKIDRLQIPQKSEKISKFSTKPLKYSCTACGKKWKTSAELKIHTKTHSTLRPYMCEKCGQAYKHKHALEIHVGMHNGINPFQCTICKKCFTQKGALMRHLPMHTGETPYQCEVCGKRFVHHTSYNMHRLSHSGKKSYKCHMCDLSLFSTSHLKRHMRVHTGEKPYSCTLCGKRFAERYNLFAHQKTHDSHESKSSSKSNEIQYKCHYCDLTFEKKKNLNDHVKHHAVAAKDNSQVKKCQDSKFDESPKKIESEDSALRQPWIEINRAKLDGTIDNQTKFVFLQNSLSTIDESSFAVTFGEPKISLESTNYNTSLQVIIESSDASILNSNRLPIDKMHM